MRGGGLPRLSSRPRKCKQASEIAHSQLPQPLPGGQAALSRLHAAHSVRVVGLRKREPPRRSRARRLLRHPPRLQGAPCMHSLPAAASLLQRLPGAMMLPSVLSPSKLPLSPAGKALAASPVGVAAKRSLAALQQQPALAARAAGGSGSGCSSSHGGGAENMPPLPPSSSSSPAAKRPEPLPGGSGGSSRGLHGAALPGPLTPGVTQPLLGGQPHPPLPSRIGAALQRPQHPHGPLLLLQQQQHHQTPPHSHQAQQRRALSADTCEVIDQFASPSAILEFPPELEDVPPPPSLHTVTPQHAPGPLHALTLPPPQPVCQAQPAPAMSGRRVTARFDVPLGLGWARGAPDHVYGRGDGTLELIMGPMFAGKTTALINRVREVAGESKLAVAVKSSADTRYGCHWVVTHDGRCMRCYTADSLAEFRELMGPAYHKLQVIAIDEAQFFPDLAEFCTQAVDDHGKHVIVAGLSGDFRRQRFGQLLDLMPLADSVTQLASKCAFCSDKALFSLRLVDGGPQALVGGDEKYRAACRRCYLEHHNVMQ